MLYDDYVVSVLLESMILTFISIFLQCGIAPITGTINTK